jgi:hypothetical protein
MIDKVFHEKFGILKCLMHELSRKPSKIFREANSLMHELFTARAIYFARDAIPVGQNISQGFVQIYEHICY